MPYQGSWFGGLSWLSYSYSFIRLAAILARRAAGRPVKLLYDDFPQRWSLKEVIEKGKEAIDWDKKWHPPGTRKLANGKMHGMGFVHVNEWHWHAPIPGISYACLTLRNGKVAIIAVRCDMGIDTESGARLCVASEIGLKYEDTVIQERRSDNSNYHFWQLGGSFGTPYITTQLVLAAGELKRKILGYAAYGSYGIGENVGASMSGITVSAIYNATGKWILDYPTTPDRVLRALNKI